MLKQQDWIDLLAKKLVCSKKEAKEYFDCIFDFIKEQISPDEIVKISNFGVFKLRKAMAKEQTNLSTGNIEIIPEHYVITFKPYFEIEAKPQSIAVGDDEVLQFTPSIYEQEELDVEEIEIDPDTLINNNNNVNIDETIDDIEWIYNNNTYKTNDLKKILLVKTNLNRNDIEASLTIIIDNINKLVPTNKKVNVIEKNDTFNFEFNK